MPTFLKDGGFMQKISELKDQQEQLASKVIAEDKLSISDIKTIGGFDISYRDNRCVVAAVVFEYPSMNLVEKKTLETTPPIPFMPTMLALREGPPICQLFNDLEHKPDVIFIDDHGLAHPEKCGVAVFVGVELKVPTIGVAKKLLAGMDREGYLELNGEIVGKTVQTKEHANPLFVSPGNLISVDTAAELAEKTVMHPHKLPEPLHAAHRLADKTIASVALEIQH